MAALRRRLALAGASLGVALLVAGGVARAESASSCVERDFSVVRAARDLSRPAFSANTAEAYNEPFYRVDVFSKDPDCSIAGASAVTSHVACTLDAPALIIFLASDKPGDWSSIRLPRAYEIEGVGEHRIYVDGSGVTCRENEIGPILPRTKQ